MDHSILHFNRALPFKSQRWRVSHKICLVLHELMEENRFLWTAMWRVAPELNIYSGSEEDKSALAERALAFLVSLLGEDRLIFKLCFFIYEDKTTSFLKQWDSEWPSFPQNAHLRGFFFPLEFGLGEECEELSDFVLFVCFPLDAFLCATLEFEGELATNAWDLESIELREPIWMSLSYSWVSLSAKASKVGITKAWPNASRDE